MKVAIVSSVLQFAAGKTMTVELDRVLLDEPMTPIHHLRAESKREAQRLLGASQGSFDISMNNDDNLSYQGPVYVGTPL